MGRERRRREIVEAHGRRKSRVDGEMQRKGEKVEVERNDMELTSRGKFLGCVGTILEYREGE